ncbi:sulfurtransferase [Winogradskya humida]|uniref:Sulfurtransferase n=2 Tax=Winogradskya humida TaxID=113566 RepID=A0ABQ3ZEJ9_9ACTN|nr:sulfurtransferase [Actinoplanes humidus]
MTGPLVDAAWLQEHLGDVVVLDASISRSPEGAFKPGSDVYAQAHIPGARFADLFTAFSDPDGAFPFTMPSVGQLRDAARAAGVHDGSHVVVYDRNGGAWAARVWWLLRVHGFSTVSVLDGGLGAWAGSLESGIYDLSPAGALTLREPGAVTADLVEVAAFEGPLVCGVRKAQFDTGHIPGSISLPYAELLRDNGTLDLSLVRSRAAGLGAEAIVYCGGGINAAGLILALEAAGLPAPRLYDGSLNEWRADPARPLTSAAG